MRGSPCCRDLWEPAKGVMGCWRPAPPRRTTASASCAADSSRTGRCPSTGPGPRSTSMWCSLTLGGRRHCHRTVLQHGPTAWVTDTKRTFGQGEQQGLDDAPAVASAGPQSQRAPSPRARSASQGMSHKRRFMRQNDLGCRSTLVASAALATTGPRGLQANATGDVESFRSPTNGRSSDARLNLGFGCRSTLMPIGARDSGES